MFRLLVLEGEQVSSKIYFNEFDFTNGNRSELFELWELILGDAWAIYKNKFIETVFHRDSRENSKIYIARIGDNLAGFISLKWKSQGQIQCLLVHPDYQCQGIGTKLLEKGFHFLKTKSISQVQLGAGAYAYFWPGVPQNLKSGLDFFQARGWNYSEESVDMVVDLKNYQIQEPLLNRVKNLGLKFSLASQNSREKILAFEKENFSDWSDFYDYHLNNQNFHNILCVHDGDNHIVGTAIVSEDENKWSVFGEKKLGAVGALGVMDSMRGQGIGLALAAKSTQINKERGFDLCTANYTYLVDWYGKLGYKVWRKYHMSWKGI